MLAVLLCLLLCQILLCVDGSVLDSESAAQRQRATQQHRAELSSLIVPPGQARNDTSIDNAVVQEDPTSIDDAMAEHEATDKNISWVGTTSTSTELVQSKPTFVADDGIHYETPVTKCKAPGTLAFTFDEGPHSVLTPQYLDILEKHNVPATFFVVGKNINGNTAPILTRMIREGHLIGHGSWSYSSFLNMSDDQVKYEISTTASAIEGVINQRPSYFRFPFGEFTRRQLDYVTQQKLLTVHWSFDAGDNLVVYDNTPGENLFIKYQQRLSPRAANKRYIAIGRDNLEVTLSQFEAIIDLARQRGYTFVRLDDCLELDSEQLTEMRTNGGTGQSLRVVEVNVPNKSVRPAIASTHIVWLLLALHLLAILLAY